MKNFLNKIDVVFILRILLGLVFVFASIEKIINPQEFSDLIDNYPNRWAAIDTGISGPAVQYVDIELFEVFKVMSKRESSSATIYYLCNTYQPPVLLMAPPEVWINDSD